LMESPSSAMLSTPSMANKASRTGERCSRMEGVRHHLGVLTKNSYVLAFYLGRCRRSLRRDARSITFPAHTLSLTHRYRQSVSRCRRRCLNRGRVSRTESTPYSARVRPISIEHVSSNTQLTIIRGGWTHRASEMRKRMYPTTATRGRKNVRSTDLSAGAHSVR
jgi:hypothetical protein